MALLRSAIDEHPQDPRLRWWLAEELHELGLQDDLQAFLRQCDRQGFPGFFESLVQSFPRSLGPEEIARIEQMDDPSAVAYAAAIWLSLGQTDRAVDTALRALARAEELGAFTHPFHIPLLVLRLQAQGLDGEAARVRERFQRFLHTSGQELALLTDRTAVLWQAAQEISRLSSEFPPPVRAAIADAVVTGSLADAVPPLRAVIAADGDAGWRMANELKELPVLHGLFHRAILEILAQRSPRPYQETSQETSSQLDRWFYLVFVCISAIALSGRYCSSPEPSAPAMPSPAMPSAPPILSIPLGPDLDGWRFGDLEDALVKACPSGAALTPGQSMLCNAAQDALASFRQGRCEAVRMTRFELLEGLQMVQGTAYEHTAKHLVALIRSKYVHACRDRTSWP